MMGHREKLKGGDEYDALTKARKIYCYLSKSGAVKAIKRRFWKRIRKQHKQELNNGKF